MEPFTLVIIALIISVVIVGLVILGSKKITEINSNTKDPIQNEILDEIVNTQPNTKKKRKTERRLIIAGVILIVLTLPFHYVPSALMVFPKDNLTFKYTFISRDLLNRLLDKHNNPLKHFMEKRNESEDALYKKLEEEGVIFTDTTKTINYNR